MAWDHHPVRQGGSGPLDEVDQALGGGTANVEFEVITGMNLGDFGTGEYPYSTILKSETCETIAYDLRNMGYTAHAIHNHIATFYERSQVYAMLGFDTFTSLEYMTNYTTNSLGWCRDKVLTGCILDALRSGEERDLVFAVSVQGHGKYSSNPPQTPYPITSTGLEDNPSLKNEFEYYINQLHETDGFLGELLDALRAAVPEGWHACTAQGTNGAPMWGDLIGSDAGGVRLHSFRYHGVPDTYRIILVTKSGESWVSGVLHRATLQSSATVDWAARIANAPSPAMAYALQFLCTLLPTLLIEGLLLFAFGYRSKRSWLVFLLVNLVTQGGFAVYLAVTVLNHGVSGWSLIFYIPIEVIITLVELLLYRRLLTEKNKARAAVYAIAANLCSAVLGLWLIDPLWHFIVSIS